MTLVILHNPEAENNVYNVSHNLVKQWSIFFYFFFKLRVDVTVNMRVDTKNGLWVRSFAAGVNIYSHGFIYEDNNYVEL